MSGLAAPRVRIPRTARAGEAIEIRTLIEHPMQSGIRVGGGAAPARDMLNRLGVTMNGAPILEVELQNGTAANPYHVFFVRLRETAEFVFTWTDERGRSVRATHRVQVG